MGHHGLVEIMLPAIEVELQKQVARLQEPPTETFHEMLCYHLGWTGENAGPEARGKRIRPLLLLLVLASCGAEWLRAVPAAAAVELIHDFSLVHDDIQDNSPKRRGRPTVWKKWNVAQAINVGDALFVMSNQAMIGLSNVYAAESVVRASRAMQEACLDLTRGQFLDMSYQGRVDLAIEDYWPMISGKTAALLSACAEIGSILGDADERNIRLYREFGRALGLAFQVQDDILGIWGDEAKTGKPAESDLVEGKNSLPVLYGIARMGKFRERWARHSIRPEEVAGVAQMLVEEGAYDFARSEAQRLTHQALEALRMAEPSGAAGQELFELTDKLLNRKS
jgi:geranylgeranyl diphosphate synthase type I